MALRGRFPQRTATAWRSTRCRSTGTSSTQSGWSIFSSLVYLLGSGRHERTSAAAERLVRPVVLAGGIALLAFGVVTSLACQRPRRGAAGRGALVRLDSGAAAWLTRLTRCVEPATLPESHQSGAERPGRGGRQRADRRLPAQPAAAAAARATGGTSGWSRTSRSARRSRSPSTSRRRCPGLARPRARPSGCARDRRQRVHRLRRQLHPSGLPGELARPDAELFLCPCHGGVYYADGTVAGGPPPQPLFRYGVRDRATTTACRC